MSKFARPMPSKNAKPNDQHPPPRPRLPAPRCHIPARRCHHHLHHKSLAPRAKGSLGNGNGNCNCNCHRCGPDQTRQTRPDQTAHVLASAHHTCRVESSGVEWSLRAVRPGLGQGRADLARRGAAQARRRRGQAGGKSLWVESSKRK
jgi:hypothetical protein